MRFFPQQPLRQLYKTFYKMTLKELEGLIYSYGPTFIRLETQQAHEERSITAYQEQIAILHAQQETLNSPKQITMLLLAIKTCEKNWQILQDEITDLANEYEKIKGVLRQRRGEEMLQPQPEDQISYDSPTTSL